MSILFCSFCWVLKNSGTSLPVVPRLLLSGSSPYPLYSISLICSLWILFLAVPPQLRFLKSNLFYVFGGAGPSLPCRFSLVAESGGSFLVTVLWLPLQWLLLLRSTDSVLSIRKCYCPYCEYFSLLGDVLWSIEVFNSNSSILSCVSMLYMSYWRNHCLIHGHEDSYLYLIPRLLSF